MPNLFAGLHEQFVEIFYHSITISFLKRTFDHFCRPYNFTVLGLSWLFFIVQHIFTAFKDLLKRVLFGKRPPFKPSIKSSAFGRTFFSFKSAGLWLWHSWMLSCSLLHFQASLCFNFLKEMVNTYSSAEWPKKSFYLDFLVTF